jgi:hypothetical protein
MAIFFDPKPERTHPEEKHEFNPIQPNQFMG